MIEQIGNLWDFHNKGEWIVITTNGFVKKNGEAVMGKGCALECKQRYPQFPSELGYKLKSLDNLPFIFEDYLIITLPVKHNWWEVADLNLIEHSLDQLIKTLSVYRINKIYMPRPGCGNGYLDWESQVKPLCEKYLDERFIILSK